MGRSLRTLTWLLCALGVLLFVHAAAAESKITSLVTQLKSDDYRERTKAALALGATGDEAAIKPLCDALKDEHASVKTAAAASLGKLMKPAGLKCLEAAIAKETVPAVKSAMQKAIDYLEAQSSMPAAPPPPGKDTKFYVAIEITNKSKRPNTEVEAIVRSAMQAKLLAQTGFAVAPRGETVARGGKIVDSKKLKGFILMATVEDPVYADGSLQVRVTVTVGSYPGKQIHGSYSPKLTQSDTPSKDTKSEDALFQLCAENAVNSFVKAAPGL